MIATRFPVRTTLAVVVIVACFCLVIVDRSGSVPALAPWVNELYGWAVILAAAALLLGVVSVLWLHIRRIQGGQRGWWQSLALVIVLVAVVVAGSIRAAADRSPLVEWVFDSVIAPGYATLFALMAVFVAGAIYRMVRVGRRGGAWVLGGLLLMLLVQTPAALQLAPEPFNAALRWTIESPVAASLRGALMGVGLALVVLAVRYLAGRRS